jgi:hypothetical protein
MKDGNISRAAECVKICLYQFKNINKKSPKKRKNSLVLVTSQKNRHMLNSLSQLWNLKVMMKYFRS